MSVAELPSSLAILHKSSKVSRFGNAVPGSVDLDLAPRDRDHGELVGERINAQIISPQPKRSPWLPQPTFNLRCKPLKILKAIKVVLHGVQPGLVPVKLHSQMKVDLPPRSCRERSLSRYRNDLILRPCLLSDFRPADSLGGCDPPTRCSSSSPNAL